MNDILLIIGIGTILLLLLGLFITFMTLAYQKKRLQHQKEVTDLVEAYQKEILKARLEMQEQTFLTISQEIHDNIGQVLSLVRLHVSTLQHAQGAAAEQKITASKQLLDQALQDLRDLSKQLNSKYVTGQSLSQLLRLQLGMIQKTGRIDACLEVLGEEKALNSDTKLIIFRIAQEALNNVIRHADASRITARLEYTGNKLALCISDDGIGFAAPDETAQSGSSKGTGTYNMHYRAGLIGAKLRIQGAPGKGTQVSLDYSLT